MAKQEVHPGTALHILESELTSPVDCLYVNHVKQAIITLLAIGVLMERGVMCLSFIFIIVISKGN